MGIVYLPAFIADRYLQDGRLVTILGKYMDSTPLEMFALYPTRSFMPAALKLFLQALSESCSSRE
jgi:DNA-binding transcriptional LysR family regulator